MNQDNVHQRMRWLPLITSCLKHLSTQYAICLTVGLGLRSGVVLQCIAPFVQGLQPNTCLSYLLDVQHQISAVMQPSLSFLSDNFTTLVVRVDQCYSQFCHPCLCNAGSCPVLCPAFRCLTGTLVDIRTHETSPSYAIILLTGAGRALLTEEG